MRRTLIWLGVVALLFAAMVGTAQAAPRLVAHPVSISINGQPQQFSPPPLLIHGRAFVPVRAVLQHLGDTVAWHKSTLSVSAQNQEPISLRLGSRQATVGGRQLMLAMAPMLIEDRVYVPSDFFHQALGATIAWVPASRTIDLALAAPSVAGFRQPAPQPEVQPAQPEQPVQPKQPEVVVPQTQGIPLTCPPGTQPQVVAPVQPVQPQAVAPVQPLEQTQAGTVVKVTLEEYKITLDQTDVPAGPVTFQIHNAGHMGHGLDIESTDIKAGVLKPGQSTTLTVNLQPNVYTLYCPVDGHRELGMKTRLTVH